MGLNDHILGYIHFTSVQKGPMNPHAAPVSHPPSEQDGILAAGQPSPRLSTVAMLRAATPQQRRTLLAAALGWMLDSMDVMLYAMAASSLQRELHMSAATSGLVMSCTLIAAAVGGILLGRFADRAGRTRALLVSMLLYSVFTGLTGLVHTVPQLFLCRILLGLGMGGEWAAGAALVAETWPDEYRSRVLSIVQSFWAVGYALGAGLTAIILPHFSLHMGWRVLFFAGTFPALATLWVRRSVQEPEMWASKQQQAAATPLSAIFHGGLKSGSLGRSTILATAMNAATLFAWWGLFFWIPGFLSQPVAQGGRGLSIVHTSLWTMLMQAGTFAGYLSFGPAAERFGRKRAYIGYLVAAAVAVPMYAATSSPTALLLLGPVVGFFGTGYFSGFAVITAELFPTALRTTAMGFCYNLGRIASAAAPYAIGRLSQGHGIAAALSLTSAGFLVAAVLAAILPETRGRRLM